MSPRLSAIATVVTGLAALSIFVAFTMLPEAKAATQCLAAGSVVQFELARNAADLAAIFGAPGSACHPLAIASMDAVNTLDIHAFIPTYTLFCVCAALFLAGGEVRRPFAIAAVLAALLALAGDYLETLTLLKLTHALDAPETLLPMSQLGAWSKFSMLAVHALCCAGLCFTMQKRRVILGVLLLLPAPGVAIAAFDHIRFADLMNAALAIAWIALIVMAVVELFRKSA